MIEFIMETQFFQRGMIAGLLIGLICPLIGTFLVVRRLSLISEALSHVTLAGVGFGTFLSYMVTGLAWINPIYMGVLFSLLGALFIDQLRKLFKPYQEISIPIVLSVGVGIGVILLSVVGLNAGVLNLLFGSIVSVTKGDLVFIIVTSGSVGLFLLLFYKELLSVSFDEEFAKLSGLPAKSLNILFAITVALTIAMAMKVVGILLVSSLITVPVANALRVAKSYKQVLLYSVLFAQSAVLIGIISGYYLNIATGGMIVATAIIQLFLVLCIQKWILSSYTRRVSHER